MNGTTYTDAPSIEQMPVAARPKRPKSRERRVGGSSLLNIVGLAEARIIAGPFR
jgi:hypothetical protein